RPLGITKRKLRLPDSTLWHSAGGGIPSEGVSFFSDGHGACGALCLRALRLCMSHYERARVCEVSLFERKGTRTGLGVPLSMCSPRVLFMLLPHLTFPSVTALPLAHCSPSLASAK